MFYYYYGVFWVIIVFGCGNWYFFIVGNSFDFLGVIFSFGQREREREVLWE